MLSVLGPPTVSCQGAGGETVGYVLISSSELKFANEAIRKSIAGLFPQAKQTYLEHDSTGAQRYIDEFNISFVPFVIFEKSLQKLRNFPEMFKRRMIKGENPEEVS